jgi:hypothetical protein
MKATLTGLAIALCISLFGKEDDDTAIVRRVYNTVRATAAVKIDGALDDAAWEGVGVADRFEQNNPVENGVVRNQTEVKLIYDNVGIYIGAMLYDSAPDSIGRQLGIRDNYDLVADRFRIVFDTYNTQQDAFEFQVTASGVQLDARVSDANFNGVWKSAVQIVSNGWVCEMLIPWSALRFPTGNNDWGLQITRSFVRNQEFDQWALTPKEVSNSMKYWGILRGLNDIDPPVRLSLTPYMTTIYQDDDRFGVSNPELSFAGGMDLKWGINESFTVDMTLLPDFSQVQSDNVVKNLGAFEQTFQDFRPFFTEGVDLFQRGDLFYSRRIGKTPTGFYSCLSELDTNEVISKNPSRARLLNATKISGRTNQGMGIGVLNAFVENTYALARDTLTGETRSILTEPRSNYNIFVMDKQLQNSSSIYFINTNVIRTGGNRSSNVTGAGAFLNNKANSYRVFMEGAVSNVLYPISDEISEFTSDIGYKYNIGIDKTSGTWQGGLSRNVMSRLWDADDLGVTFENNFAANRGWLMYQLFNPKWIFRYASSDVSVNYNYNLVTGKSTYVAVNWYNYFSFNNLSNFYIGYEWNPTDFYDYFEPRVPGRAFRRTRIHFTYMGYGSNYNKPFNWGVEFYTGKTADISPTIPFNPWIGGALRLTWRASDRLLTQIISSIHTDWGDRGWVNIEQDGAIIFGRRNIRNLETSFMASYVFMKDMTITLNARHYWATGQYLNYYILQEDGTLRDYVTYSGNHDFSFNSINADIVYSWIFAPGSIVSVAYKLNTMTEEQPIVFSYKHNFRTTMQAPQLNQLSVRVLYYLDYQYITKSLRRSR